MSHRSDALSALEDIERAASGLRVRLGELEAIEAEQTERAAAAVEVSRTLRRRADDLCLAVMSEALELGVAPGVGMESGLVRSHKHCAVEFVVRGVPVVADEVARADVGVKPLPAMAAGHEVHQAPVVHDDCHGHRGLFDRPSASECLRDRRELGRRNPFGAHLLGAAFEFFSFALWSLFHAVMLRAETDWLGTQRGRSWRSPVAAE